jgi:hypothetical protein
MVRKSEPCDDALAAVDVGRIARDAVDAGGVGQRQLLYDTVPDLPKWTGVDHVSSSHAYHTVSRR